MLDGNMSDGKKCIRNSSKDVISLTEPLNVVIVH